MSLSNFISLNKHLIHEVLSYIYPYEREYIHKNIKNHKITHLTMLFNKSFNLNPKSLVFESAFATDLNTKCALDNRFVIFESLKDQVLLAYIKKNTSILKIVNIDISLFLFEKDTELNTDISCVRHFQGDQDYIIVSSRNCIVKIFNSLSTYDCLQVIKTFDMNVGIELNLNCVQGFFSLKTYESYIICSLFQSEYLQIYDLQGNLVKEYWELEENSFFNEVFFFDDIDDYLILNLIDVGFKLIRFNDLTVFRNKVLLKSKPITAVHYQTSNRSMLAIGSVEGFLNIYDVKEHLMKYNLNMEGQVRSLVSWGKYIIVAVNKKIMVVDTDDLLENTSIFSCNSIICTLRKGISNDQGEFLVSGNLDGSLLLFRHNN
jgi:hypothetical protein